MQASKNNVAVNEQFTLRASWSGGYAPYYVHLFLYDVSTGNGYNLENEGLSAGQLDSPMSISSPGTYKCRITVVDSEENTKTAQSATIIVGGKSTPTHAPSPSPKPAPKPAGKLQIDYIEPHTINSNDSTFISFDIGISGAEYPCTAQYEITDMVTGIKKAAYQDSILSDSFELLLGPDVSNDVTLNVKVIDNRGKTGEKERTTTENNDNGKATGNKKGKLQISGINAEDKNGMVYYTVMIEGGTPPYNASYDFQYWQANTHNIWSGYIGEKSEFCVMTRDVPVGNIVFKVWDAAGASAEKEYNP